MAQVPTILADRSIRTGSTGPEASAASFGSQNAQQLDAFGNGLEKLGQGARQASADVYSVQKHIEAIDNHRWATEAKSRYDQALTDFTNDPANAGKDSFHNDTKAFSQQIISNFKQGAPNPEALGMFMESALSREDEAYTRAVKTVVTEKVQASAAAIQQGLNVQSSIYRTNISQDPAGAKTQFDNYLSKSISDVDALYGKTQPRIATALKEQMTVDAILGVANANPAHAREILDGSQAVDGKTRSALVTQIDRIENEQNSSARLAVSKLADDAEAAMSAGNMPKSESYNKLLDPRTWSVFGKSGEKYHERFMEKAQEFLGAQVLINDIKDIRPENQHAALAQSKEGIQTAESLHSQKTVENFVAVNNHVLKTKGVVTWLNSYNSDVQSAFNMYRNAATDQDKKVMWSNYVDTLLKFQGYPPEGVNAKEQERYQMLPDSHVLSMDAESPTSAPGLIDQINSNAGNPDKVLEIFHSLRAQYPDEKFNIALSDLFSVKHENPLNGQFRLLAMNLDESFAPQFAKAISNRNAVRGEDPKALEPMYDRLRNNSTFTSVREALAPKDAKEFGDAVVTYAALLTTEAHLSPSSAVDKAAELLLTKSMSHQQVNGIPVIFPKNVDGHRIDDDSYADGSKRLTRILGNLDASQIEDYTFPRAKAMFPQDPEGKAEAISSVISKDGFWRVTNDGRKVQLAIKDATGQSLYVFRKDKSGNPAPIEIPIYPNVVVPVTVGARVDSMDPDTNMNLDNTNFPMKKKAFLPNQ